MLSVRYRFWHEVLAGPGVSVHKTQGKLFLALPNMSTNQDRSSLFVISAPLTVSWSCFAHRRPLQPATLSDSLFTSLPLNPQTSHHSHSFQSSILFYRRVHFSSLSSYFPHLTQKLQVRNLAFFIMFAKSTLLAALFAASTQLVSAAVPPGCLIAAIKYAL